jgi:ATP-binding cassette subfamily F protein 3
LIYIKEIGLTFADRTLFDNLNWTIPDRGRVGLVGDNGAGKTTLLKIISGLIEPDKGSIEIPNRKKTTIGYLPQDLVELDPIPLLEFIRIKSGVAALEEELKICEEALSSSGGNDDDHEKLLSDYERSLAQFDAINGYSFEARAKQMLAGFGFQETDFTKNCADFSGGWKMRIMLSVILLSRPDIMLLDEPTNHLDTESMEWMESQLKDYPGTMITITHDRVFLDKITGFIAELSNRKMEIYKGNYSFYLKEKERRKEALKKEMELQKAEIKRIREFVERFRYKATKANQVQSRLKMLERFDSIREEGEGKTVAIRFPESPKSGKEVLSVKGLAKSYGNHNVFHDLNFTLYRGEKAAVVGMNGAGKSTLSRILSGEETASSGEITVGLNVKGAFFSQESAMNLNYERTIWEEVSLVGTRSNDQQRRNLLGAFLFSGDDVYKKISVLSGGEKSRLALLKILLEDTNLLILDEPTNHLDIKTKDVFQNALLNYGGTILIVSHDRYFLDNLVGRVFELRDGVCHDYKGNYSWFIEKRKELLLPPPAPSISTPSIPSASHCLPSAGTDLQATDKNDKNGGEAKSKKTKEEKRQEAEERNRISKATAHLRQELTKTETQISLLEGKKRGIEAALCETENYQQPERIKQMSLDLRSIEVELEDMYYRWNDLTLKIEAWEESSP